jgi:phosphoglycolate phosphatase-like HAD superfamily hydrolase
VLLLFDIDGTLLLKAFAAHREALHAAIGTVYGLRDLEDAEKVTAAGRTDGEIAREILLQHGVSAERIEERAERFRDACAREYVRRCPPDLSDLVAPGVLDLLEALEGREGVKLSLLTGNFEPIARLKLTRAGIGRHFPHGQGAFGSDRVDRTELPAIARRRAGTREEPWPRHDTVVIGDTPADIACARADELRCLAVATGPFPADELSKADVVVPNARALLPEIEKLLPRRR